MPYKKRYIHSIIWYLMPSLFVQSWYTRRHTEKQAKYELSVSPPAPCCLFSQAKRLCKKKNQYSLKVHQDSQIIDTQQICSLLALPQGVYIYQGQFWELLCMKKQSSIKWKKMSKKALYTGSNSCISSLTFIILDSLYGLTGKITRRKIYHLYTTWRGKLTTKEIKVISQLQ